MLRDGSKILYKAFKKGVSYRVGDIGENLLDAQNVLLIEDRIETRPAKKKYSSAALPSQVISLSHYINSSGSTKKLIAKSATSLYADNGNGTFSSIKSSLTSGVKHDGITVNGRHIIALGGDGLYAYDGTTIDTLGIPTPTAPTVAAAAGGSLADKTWQVALTYESSTYGAESNQGTASSSQATSGGNNTIAVSAIPASSHGFTDKINIFLKNVTDGGDFLFVAQIDDGTTTYNITDEPTSTQEPPTLNSVPSSGGGKYLAFFNEKLVYAGNGSFPSDVYFSQSNNVDAFGLTGAADLFCPGDGPITGLAVGLYGGDILNQYLIIFKKRSIHLYNEDSAGNPTFMTIDQRTGCTSHKTIVVKDGNVWFMSDSGWRVIENGRLNKKHLADGDIDDIFKSSGFVYEVNKQNTDDAFSVYYSELNSYMTWVSEGAANDFSKCYNYHFDYNAFMPQVIEARSACIGEDSTGRETVFIGDDDGYVYNYDIRKTGGDEATEDSFILDVSQLDVDELEAGTETAIDSFVYLNWLPFEDFDASYNFRSFFVDTVSDPSATDNDLIVKVFINYDRSSATDYAYDIQAATGGFILDQSMLDVDILGDDRSRKRTYGDIMRSGYNILIGLVHNELDTKLKLIAAQLNLSKNGNTN